MQIADDRLLFAAIRLCDWPQSIACPNFQGPKVAAVLPMIRRIALQDQQSRIFEKSRISCGRRSI